MAPSPCVRPMPLHCASDRRAASSRTTGRRSCTSAARSASLDPSMQRRRGARRRSTACCSPAARTSRRRATAKQPHPTVGRRRAGARRVRDRAGRARRARSDLPILAICRGIQVLNVACGGTLVQDIPSQVAGRARAQLDGAAAPAVRPRARSLGRQGLAAGAADARAPERRRYLRGQQPASPGGQAGRRRASACRPPRPTASSRRSRIPPRAFCLGVQWHPENFWRTGEFRPLFEGFLEAATQRP